MNQGKSNFIHPTAIIGPGVTMGEDNYIGPYCYITGKTSIGNGNRFEAYCSVGTPPEHKDFWNTGKAFSGVNIGNRNTFREFITINAGTEANTEIFEKVIMLRGSHVGHDAAIGSEVTLSCNVLIGGHVIICAYANIGLGAIIHQRQFIAVGCMIGMGSVVTKGLKTTPYKTYVGNPARLLGENSKHPNYTIYMQQFAGECNPE